MGPWPWNSPGWVFSGVHLQLTLGSLQCAVLPGEGCGASHGPKEAGGPSRSPGQRAVELHFLPEVPCASCKVTVGNKPYFLSTYMPGGDTDSSLNPCLTSGWRSSVTVVSIYT